MILHYVHTILVERLKVLSVASIMGNSVNITAESMEVISLHIVDSVFVVINVISTLSNFKEAISLVGARLQPSFVVCCHGSLLLIATLGSSIFTVAIGNVALEAWYVFRTNRSGEQVHICYEVFNGFLHDLVVALDFIIHLHILCRSL